MPSKVLDEYLKNASPAEKAALVENGLKLDRNGVELANNSPQSQAPPAIEERADVKQIGQDLKNNGAELKPDANGPQTPARIGESRPHADPPKFMDEQKQGQEASGQTLTQDEKNSLQQTDQKVERSGQQNQPQDKAAGPQEQKHQSPVDEVIAADAKRESQTKAPEQEKTQSQPAPQSQAPER